MSPSFGWFRTAVAQTRFDWAATPQALRSDGDGRIARGEFPGDDADFARLDRDRDKALSAADFDFSGSALASSPGAMLFMRADCRRQRQGHARGARRVLEGGRFAAARGSCRSPTCRRHFPRRRSRPSSAGSGRPSKATLVRGLFRQEIGSLEPGPKVDDSAPDFTLKTNDGKAEVTLSKLIGPKPVVLVFGSFTCGPFRSQSGNIEKLFHRYKDRATFVMVYVREAHPTDGWRMESNDRLGAVTAQPKTYDERVAVAQKCGRVLSLGFPDARRHDRRRGRHSLQRHAGPSLRDRPPGQGRVQERARPLSVQTRRDGAFARAALAGRGCNPGAENKGLPARLNRLRATTVAREEERFR